MTRTTGAGPPVLLPNMAILYRWGHQTDYRPCCDITLGFCMCPWRRAAGPAARSARSVAILGKLARWCDAVKATGGTLVRRDTGGVAARAERGCVFCSPEATPFEAVVAAIVDDRPTAPLNEGYGVVSPFPTALPTADGPTYTAPPPVAAISKGVVEHSHPMPSFRRVAVPQVGRSSNDGIRPVPCCRSAPSRPIRKAPDWAAAARPSDSLPGKAPAPRANRRETYPPVPGAGCRQR